MSWRERLVTDIHAQINPFVIVEDPDGLLNEPGILQVLAERGYEILFFHDPIAFRYAYESHIRNQTYQPVVVVIDSEEYDARHMPFDILQNAKVIALSLAELFPSMHSGVLRLLQPTDLAALDQALSIYSPSVMGENQSFDFALRHVYQIAPELIQSPADLLRTLLRKHYRQLQVPAALDKRLIGLLSHQDQFKGWPLATIIADSKAFFSFLQQHWPLYIEKVLALPGKEIKESRTVYNVSKNILPFAHDDVRVYIDNLFLEGILQPKSLGTSRYPKKRSHSTTTAL